MRLFELSFKACFFFLRQVQLPSSDQKCHNRSGPILRKRKLTKRFSESLRIVVMWLAGMSFEAKAHLHITSLLLKGKRCWPLSGARMPICLHLHRIWVPCLALSHSHINDYDKARQKWRLRNETCCLARMHALQNLPVKPLKITQWLLAHFYFIRC